MSTIAYAALTSVREKADPNTSSSTEQPGVKSYVDTLAALVPAEVLAAHAAVLPFTTSTTTGSDGQAVTTITAPDTLRWVFVALLLVAVLLYVARRLSEQQMRWEPLDFARMLIAPLAFVGWTMLQKATAFDAVWPGLDQASRAAMGIIGAVVLGILAGLLAVRADQKVPVPAPAH